jgi:hypothetical protein
MATYASGSGSANLIFNYTVQAGDSTADLDYVNTTALALNSGTIADIASNGANLTLATPGEEFSLGYNKAIVINTSVPTIVNVTSSKADGAYTTGELIPITVEFSENVFVNTTDGTPSLELNSATGRMATYASGSGSANLIFNYTVQAGDSTADLDYVNTTALALNSGTIADIASNGANLTLATPGEEFSLGYNKAIVINTSVPTIVNVTSSKADGAYTTGELIPITVEFSENVFVNTTGRHTKP